MTPKSKKILNGIYGQTGSALPVPEYQRITKIFLSAVDQALEPNNLQHKQLWIENHLELFFRNPCVNFDINVATLSYYKNIRAKELEAIKVILASNAISLLGDPDSLASMKELNIELINTNLYMTDLEKFLLTSKGPKTDIIKASFAKKILEIYEDLLAEIDAFDLPIVFDGCFISTNLSTNTSKASPVKLAVIALNLLGYKTDQRQLNELLIRYDRLPKEYRSPQFIENCRYFLTWRDVEFC